MYFASAASLRERPGQHELGFEHCLAGLHSPIEGGAHPAQDRMAEPPLDVLNQVPGIGLIPAPIEVFGDHPKLDDEIGGEILGLNLASFLPPQARERLLVIAHDDPGV
jgi:hypothetical protein